MQRRRDHRFWENKTWLSELQCNFTWAEKMSVFVGQSVGVQQEVTKEFKSEGCGDGVNSITKFYILRSVPYNSIITIGTNQRMHTALLKSQYYNTPGTRFGPTIV